MAVGIHLLPLASLALHLKASFLPVVRPRASVRSVSTSRSQSSPSLYAAPPISWTFGGKLGWKDWNKAKVSVITWQGKRGCDEIADVRSWFEQAVCLLCEAEI